MGRTSRNITTYVHFTEEQKHRANNVDLENFLRCKGEILEKSGREKRLKSDKSITVRGNTWYDHSKSVEKGGYAIDFVQMFYGLSFPDAVIELIGEQENELSPVYKGYEKKEEPPKVFALPPKNHDMRRTFAYLSKHRCIDYSVLSFFAKQNLIYESKELSKDGLKEYHNVIFVGYDADQIPRHGHKRSIYSEGKKFMMNIEGSKPEHSFHYLGSRASTGNQSNRLYVFEAPIDLLSFISLNKTSDWQAHNYVAMCGITFIPILQQLENNKQLNHVVMGMDNDNAGNSASKELESLLLERNIFCSRIVPVGKDFNEDLQVGHNQGVEQQTNNDSTGES